MSAEGALREDVLNALRQKGCTLDAQEDGSIRIGLKAIVQVHAFRPVVSRTKLQQLCRAYEVSMAGFFPRLNEPAKPKTAK